MNFKLHTQRPLALAAVIASGALAVSTSQAQPAGALYPELVDASHATQKTTAFFSSFFTAKSSTVALAVSQNRP